MKLVFAIATLLASLPLSASNLYLRGPATIIRPRGTLVLDVDATRAKVRSTGAMLSVRYRL